MHERVSFEPVGETALFHAERKRAIESLIFLAEKKGGSAKGRTAENSSTQRSHMHEDNASSPTVAAESILLTSAHEAKEERDMMTFDVLNTFLQTNMLNDDSKRKGYYEAQRCVSRQVARD